MFGFDKDKHDVVVMKLGHGRGGIIETQVSMIESMRRDVMGANGELWICAEDARWGEWITVTPEELGRARQASHEGQRSAKCERYYEDEAEEHIVGAAGEVLFGREFGLEPCVEDKRFGDDGIDFSTKVGTIDVKTSRRIPFLMVKECDALAGKVADILVLVRGEVGNMRIAGYAHGDKVEEWPKKRFRKGGYVNYYLPEVELKPIERLRQLLGAEWRHGELMGVPWRLVEKLRDAGWILDSGVQLGARSHLFCMMPPMDEPKPNRRGRFEKVMEVVEGMVFGETCTLTFEEAGWEGPPAKK